MCGPPSPSLSSPPQVWSLRKTSLPLASWPLKPHMHAALPHAHASSSSGSSSSAPVAFRRLGGWVATASASGTLGLLQVGAGGRALHSCRLPAPYICVVCVYMHACVREPFCWRWRREGAGGGGCGSMNHYGPHMGRNHYGPSMGRNHYGPHMGRNHTSPAPHTTCTTYAHHTHHTCVSSML